MNASARTAGDVTILSLSGRLMGGPDAETARRMIREALEQGVRKIIIDIGDISWVNSSGLGILIATHLSVTSAGGAVKLCRVNNRIKQLFMVTQLQSVFDTYESEAEALQSFASSKQ